MTTILELREHRQHWLIAHSIDTMTDEQLIDSVIISA